MSTRPSDPPAGPPSPAGTVRGPASPDAALDDLAARLARVVEVSPADASELVWIETVAASVAVGEREPSSMPPRRQRIAQVRVALGSAPGAQRTGFQCIGFASSGPRAAEPPAASELENAMRSALGQARLAAPAPWSWEPPAPGDDAAAGAAAGRGAGAADGAGAGAQAGTDRGGAAGPAAEAGSDRSGPRGALAEPQGPSGEAAGRGLHDPRVAALDEETAIALLEAGREGGERLRLEWGEVRLAVANSRGLVRTAAATTLTLHAVAGRGATAGRAAASARTFDALAAPAVVERARRRAGEGEAGGALPEAPPLLLAAEAAAVLLRLLNRGALTSAPFLEGTSPWAGRVGHPVADAALTLIDDGTDPAGLPFPCDLAGRATRRLPMIVDGVLRTPAVDEALAARLGLPVTPHSFGLDEHRAGHLFLAAGTADRGELMAAAAGGLTVAALEDAHLGTAPGTFRAVLRGVRRLVRNEPAGAVEDLVWEGELAAVFACVLAIGTERVALASGGPWGAAVTPPLALGASGTLVPRRR